MAKGMGAMANRRKPNSHSRLHSAPPQTLLLCKWTGRSSFRVCARFCSTPPMACGIDQRRGEHSEALVRDQWQHTA